MKVETVDVPKNLVPVIFVIAAIGAQIAFPWMVNEPFEVRHILGGIPALIVAGTIAYLTRDVVAGTCLIHGWLAGAGIAVATLFLVPISYSLVWSLQSGSNQVPLGWSNGGDWVGRHGLVVAAVGSVAGGLAHYLSGRAGRLGSKAWNWRIGTGLGAVVVALSAVPYLLPVSTPPRLAPELAGGPAQQAILAMIPRPMTTGSVESAIAAHGTTEVLQALFYSNRFDELLGNVKTGNRSWIGVARRLHSVSDAGSAEQLGEALDIGARPR